ncbi:MAG: vanadium-dependent haloperoxidase [Planctomycetaceae bacterium]
MSWSACSRSSRPYFDAELAVSLAAIRRGPGRNQGIALGESVANQILAWRSHDGSNVKINYTPGIASGLWRPTPPGFAPALDPQWGQVTPFALASGSQFRPGPPPALTSPEYAAALDQAERLGASDSTTRTADQTQIALFWADGAGTETPPGHWNTIAERVALERHDSLAKDARIFALLDITLADAAIACWDAKYTYDLWRPAAAIRTTADPGWTPLLVTPPFPSYFSGHSTFSAAATAVLSGIYGPNTAFTTTSDALPGVTRSFPSFQAAAEEAGMSRIYGGIHYQFDNQAGLAVGRQIGRYILHRELLPLKPGGKGQGRVARSHPGDSTPPPDRGP